MLQDHTKRPWTLGLGQLKLLVELLAGCPQLGDEILACQLTPLQVQLEGLP